MYPYGHENISLPTLVNLALEDDDEDPLPEHARPQYRSASLGPPLGHPPLDTPANFYHQGPLQGNGNGGITPSGAFDPFVTTPTPMTPGGPVSANPYSHDPAAAMGGAFFANQTGFQQPVR
jgi:PAB-dependent poly(A)-specific ribonuclease subunit 3